MGPHLRALTRAGPHALNRVQRRQPSLSTHRPQGHSSRPDYISQHTHDDTSHTNSCTHTHTHTHKPVHTYTYTNICHKKKIQHTVRMPDYILHLFCSDIFFSVLFIPYTSVICVPILFMCVSPSVMNWQCVMCNCVCVCDSVCV